MPPEDPIPTDADLVALREEPRPEFMAALDARMAGALAGARLEEERRARRGRELRLPRLAWPALATMGAAAVAVTIAIGVVTGGGDDDPALTARVEAGETAGGAAAPSASAFESESETGDAGDDAAGTKQAASILTLLPAEGEVVRLRFTALAAGRLDVVLTGPGGKPVLRRRGIALPAGDGVVSLSVSDAPAGTYALSATSRTPVASSVTGTVELR